MTPKTTYSHAQADLTEAQYQAQIVAMAKALGWRVIHHRYSIGTAPGFPDLELMHLRHGVMWLEVKGKNGKPSKAQVDFLEFYRAAGYHAYVVKPCDVEIVEQLLTGQVMTPNFDGTPVGEANALIAHEEQTR